MWLDCNTCRCYNGIVAQTLSIRLEETDRKILKAAARRRGKGLSTFVRGLAEAEARRLRRAQIRAEGGDVVAYLNDHPEAQVEIEGYGNPLGELP